MSNTTGPIIIGGTGRSGTSIAGSIVSRHPEVFYVGESQLFHPIFGVTGLYENKTSAGVFKQCLLGEIRQKILASCKTRYPQCNFATVYTEKKLADIFNATNPEPGNTQSAAQLVNLVLALGAKALGRPRVCEKTPHTITQAVVLHAFFPDLKFIHIFRDPKDVCASVLECSWGPENVEDFIVYWTKLMQTALDQKSKIPQENYLTVSLEQLIENPNATTELIFSFAGIEKSPQIVASTTHAVDKKQANIGRWGKNMTAQDAGKIDRATEKLYKIWQAIRKKDEKRFKTTANTTL